MEKNTSYAAAAFWFPVLSGADPRITSMAARSLEVFSELSKNPDSGVRPARLRVCYTSAKEPNLDWRAAVGTTEVPADELPPGCECGFDAAVFRMQMEQYLTFLKLEAEKFGVRFEKSHITDLGTLPDEVIINCTGIFAQNLVTDLELKPIRGQVALVSQSEAFTARKKTEPFDILIVEGPLPDGKERLDYIVPRDNDVLLGGTADHDDYLLTARLEQRETILRNCTLLFPELKDSAILADRVGLRPYRPTLRLCMETLPGGPSIIHAYGHGGSGVTLSWGTAEYVQGLAAQVIEFQNSTWHAVPKPRLRAA